MSAVLDMAERAKTSGVKTTDVFRAGIEMHLRGRFSASEKIVPMVRLGVQKPRHELVIQWAERVSNQAHLPRLSQEVQFYAVMGGVLHIANGEVSKLSEGRLPRIRSSRAGPRAGTVYLGLQFDMISESQLATLELWLLAHAAYLREAWV